MGRIFFLVCAGSSVLWACVGDATNPGGDAGDAQTGDAPQSADSATDAADSGACSPTGAFGAPVELANLHAGGAKEYAVRFSSDGLSALIYRVASGQSNGNLYLADRGDTTAPFGTGTLLGPEVNGNGLDGGTGGAGVATWADAKKTIYFEARSASIDIMSAARASTSSATFQPRAPVPSLSGNGDHAQPYFAGSDLYFMFNAGDGTGVHVEYAHRGASSFDPQQTLTNLAGFSFPVVTPDEDTIFVEKNAHIYETHRNTPQDAFGVPAEIASVVSTGHETPTDVSADGCTLYFTRADLDGGSERRVFMTTRSK